MRHSRYLNKFLQTEVNRDYADTQRETLKLENKEEQIIETRDKPQYLDTQRYLSYLQYPDATKSSTKDLSLPQINLKSSWY